MFRWVVCLFIFLFLVFMEVGCWDRHELSEEGFILGWGMDLSADGQFIGTAQIVLPSKIRRSSEGGSEDSGRGNFLTLSAKGKNILDAAGNIQLMCSRYLFAGHRQNIFIGEELAKKGFSQVIDEYSRNPNVRLRTDIFVVKKGSAQKLLSALQPFERIPAQEFSHLNFTLGNTRLDELRFMLMDYSDPYSCVSIPAFEYATKKDKFSVYKYAGRAVFRKNAQLVGYIDALESRIRGWMLNQQKHPTPYTIDISKKRHQTITVDLQSMKGNIHSTIDKNRVSFTVALHATAFLRENESSLNTGDSDTLRQVEAKLNQQIQMDAENMIHRVQKEYGSDIFHFGQTLHREHPYDWKESYNNWNQQFQTCDVHVETDITISKIGLTADQVQVEKGKDLP